MYLDEPIIANIPVHILYETKYEQSSIRVHGAFLDKTKALKFTSPRKHLFEMNMYLTNDDPIHKVYVVIKNKKNVQAIYPKKQDAEHYSKLLHDTFVQEFVVS